MQRALPKFVNDTEVYLTIKNFAGSERPVLLGISDRMELLVCLVTMRILLVIGRVAIPDRGIKPLSRTKAVVGGCPFSNLRFEG